MGTVVFQPEARKARAERAAWLAKYVAEVFMVPLTITEELTQEVKSYVRSLIPESMAFDEYYPEVVLSYATGRREQDCPGAGPGMYYAAGVVRILHECGLQCFSGLHVPVGRDWKVFMLRIKGRLANAKVLIIIKTAALYESKPCLEEINSAIEREIPLIPICFQEKNLPRRREQWAKFKDERSELMIANVQEHLGKINDIPNPGTLLNVPSTLDEIIKEINKHVTTKAREPTTIDTQPFFASSQSQPRPSPKRSDIELGELMTAVGPVNSHHDQGSTKQAVPVPVNMLNLKHTTPKGPAVASRLPEPKSAVATAAPNPVPALGQRFAIGSCVFVKRSDGQETLAYVNTYDAKEALYTVEIEALGSGKAIKCHDKDLRAANVLEGLIGSARASLHTLMADDSQSHHA
jgi:hypothetical protein